MGQPSADERPDADDVLAGIGARLRRARIEIGISARELARKAGVSVSLVSQIENGKARPSVASLYAMVQHLDLSVDELFGSVGAEPPPGSPEPRPSGDTVVHADFAALPKLISAAMVQPADSRGTLMLEGGITWERLTPRDVPGVDFLRITYDVGASSCPEGRRQTHSGHEFGYVLQGRLGVTVGFDTSEIGPGDSVYFDSATPHRLFNAGSEPVVGVWMVHAPFAEPQQP